MQNKLKLAFIYGVAISSPSFAEPTSEDLTKIEAETTVLKAQAKKLDVKAQIANKQAEIASKNAEIERLALPSNFGDPAIRSIEGIGASRIATIQLENGSAVEVREGDVLPNGMKIISIRQNEVVVQTHKKKRVRLAFAPQASASMIAGYPGQGMGLPVPPMPLPGKGVSGR